jgi:hypothetical protein
MVTVVGAVSLFSDGKGQNEMHVAEGRHERRGYVTFSALSPLIAVSTQICAFAVVSACSF